MFANRSNAQSQSDEISSLKGIKSIFVLVEDLSPEIESIGITEDYLRTKLELKLRQSGIKISNSGDQYLYLNLNMVNLNSNLFAYHIGLEFHQTVMLKRNNNLIYGATTWDKGFTGIAGSVIVKDSISDSISDLMDYFLNDFLEVNPQKK